MPQSNKFKASLDTLVRTLEYKTRAGDVASNLGEALGSMPSVCVHVCAYTHTRERERNQYITIVKTHKNKSMGHLGIDMMFCFLSLGAKTSTCSSQEPCEVCGFLQVPDC